MPGNQNKPTTLLILLMLLFATVIIAQEIKNTKKKKDIRDYTDAEIEQIYDQWEDSDEDQLEDDELPEWKRKGMGGAGGVSLDLTKMDLSKPEQVLEATKKGKTLMMFASVAGHPSATELEQISSLWQQGLFNGHIDAQRYIVGEGRVLFVLSDGSQAWRAKDYLVSLHTCASVTLEGRDYVAAGGDVSGDNNNKKNKKNEKNENNNANDKGKGGKSKKKKTEL